MPTDLRHQLREGMNNLLTWRNRYTKIDYPEKIVLNIFYRKYTMEFMFPEIEECFENDLSGNPKTKWQDFNEGFQKLKTLYSSTSVSKTQSILLNLLKDTNRMVGNTNYNFFTSLIAEAKSGNYSKLEEIEYAYLYYLLTDECVILWGAFGGTGLNKIETIAKMSGFLIEAEEIKAYAPIEQILGQFCAAEYLKDNYKALPPNV